jgi:hypothetical protein
MGPAQLDIRHKGTKDAATIHILCQLSLCPLCLYDFSAAAARAHRTTKGGGPINRRPIQLDELFTDTQLLDQGPIFDHIFFLKIFQQIATLANQFQQTATGMMILGMGFKMLGEVEDSIGQQSNLDLTGTGIPLVRLKFFDNFFFFLC